MQHSARHTSISSSAKSAIIFVIVAGVLGCAVWLGWSLLHRKYTLPTFSGLQSSVKVSVGITGAPESLDIRTTDDDSLDRVLLGNVYETLLKRDDNNKIQPSLASSWKVSEDGTTYRFNLRSGATFADGTTITSSDAVWSLQQIITKKYVGSDELSALSNVESDGNSTLVLRLREPDPRLLAKLTTRIGIVYNQRENIDYAKQASGSGPFTVSQWQSGKQLTLSRNDHYWGSKSKAKTVTVNFAADTTELAKALNNGQIDAAVALDQSAADAVKDDGIVKKQGVSNRKVVLAFSNNTQSILSDKRFRQAVRYLIDKNAMTEALGGGTVMTGFGHGAVLGVADQVIEAVKSGAIRHFFLVGGCDGARPGRNYYTEFVKQTPADTVVLTLACGKYRFNDLDLGTIDGLPRLMDVGQCNDAYSAIQIAVALADAFGCGVNDLPLSMVLSWYEQKAVCILLTLLYLGIKNIRLGPTLPAFVSPNVLNYLVENFGIAPITTPEEDLKQLLK